MLHQQRFDVRMAFEKRNQFRPAIAAKSDNTGPVPHD